MKSRARWIAVSVLVAVLLATAVATAAAVPTDGDERDMAASASVGTGFTYQGQLKNGGEAVNDNCDMAFRLHDDAMVGYQFGSAITTTVPIVDGLFTVSLDFGGVFTGTARWLGIAVQCPGDAGFTTLSPRQALTPAPYALAMPGLWTQQNVTSPNLVGGYGGNYVVPGVVGATIGGGGSDGRVNQVAGDYGAVGGGRDNVVEGASATIGGGYHNTASDDYTTVSGGCDNDASGEESTVGGGYYNTASGQMSVVAGGQANTASSFNATVGGGYSNEAAGTHTTVGGGYDNEASSSYSTVGGGRQNAASADYATVGGGYDSAASGSHSTVGGGYSNTASEDYATVGGGTQNQASGSQSTIGGGEYVIVTGDRATVAGGSWITVTANYAAVGGGWNNEASGPWATVAGGGENIASGWLSTVGGGDGNAASNSRATVSGGGDNEASGYYSTVAGGRQNVASGMYSFAAGRYAQATDAGSFVWSSSSLTTSSWGDNTFTARSHGGARFYTDGGTSTGVQLSAGGGSWASISDRNAKENFADVDAVQVLERLAELPIQTWNLKAQREEMRHVGPVAQDFNTRFAYLFGEVESEVHINNMDAIGISMAAIQGLHAQNQTLEAENAALRSEMDDLEARLEALEMAVGGGSAPAQGSQISRLPWAGLLLGAVGLVWASRRRLASFSSAGGGR